ncbi:MAG TPA: DUF1302 domain-containing protein [Steroidobacteraceae bacterium]|nr:DUF1302 domain-containing protein [Steroidobacteraceae bacterium]
MRNEVRTKRFRQRAAALAAVATVAAAPAARAVGIQYGELNGSWDTTIAYGQSWRVANPDCRLIAIADGGCGRSPNIDDGDLNYGKGTFSRALTAVTELSLNFRNFGMFARASGLYDFAVEDDDTLRTPLSAEARNLVGAYTRMLDAFAYYRFDLGTMPSELRLGKQVVSWGESTFIQNGLNTVNHFDVSAIRTPGSELKQALLPDQMAVFNIQFTERISSQFLYLFKWDQTKPEPDGSYFSTNDVATPGGHTVVLNFGEFSDQGVDFRTLGGPLIANFQQIPRLADHQPPDSGQYGMNFKFYLPNFNNGTEIGLYFLNYHSRLPVVSFRTGTQVGIGNAFGALNAVGAAAQALAAGLPYAAAVATGAAVGAQRAAAAGGNLSAATAQQYAIIGANTLLAGGDVSAQAANIATSEYSQTAGYYDEYPQNIKMLGLSFNTQFQKSGIALQGEVTYRHNVPLQYDDVELVYAALTPFEAGIAQLRGLPLPATCLPGAGATLSRCNQFGAYGPNQVVQGWGLHDTWQAQFTATKSFANVLKASQLVLVFESAVDYIPSLQDKYSGGPNGQGLRYDGPGTNVSGNPALTGFQFGTLEPGDRFPDRTSWGYVLAGRLEYPNLIGAWNILPHFSFEHDVHGTSPGPGGNFIQGRFAGTVGVTGSLQSRWELSLDYTNFGGAGQYNLLNDRDFLSASIKYSF